MIKKPLGRTGILASEIGIGAWQLAGPLLLDGKSDGHPDLGKPFVIDLIRRCGDLGINLIDTAEQYGAGESENRVGEAVRGRRDRWVISTKFGAIVGPKGERVNDVSAKRVSVSLEGSLRRLRTDYIDVYLYHVPPDPKEAEGVARVLEDAKRAGKVRAVGASTNSLETVKLLRSLGGADVVEFSHSLLHGDAALMDYLVDKGIGGLARGALAGGRLSGKYFDAPPRFVKDDIRSNWFNPETAAEFLRYAPLREFVRPDRTMAQFALRYVLDHPSTGGVLLGAKSFDDYAAAVAACALPPLTAAERARLAELRARTAA